MGRAVLGLPIPLLCYLLDAATAQSLEFVNPAPNALTALGDDLGYEQGEQVEVRWTSDFEATNVDVYQGEDGAYALESLGRMDKTTEWLTSSAGNLPPSNTSLTWTASAILGTNLSLPFHFQLSNGAGSTQVSSLDFYVRQDASASSSTSTSSSTPTSSSDPQATTSAASTTSSTTSSSTGSSSNNPISGAAADQSSSDNSDDSNEDLKLGLGIGLGVGIPLLLALLACLVFCCWRRRKRQRASTLPRGRKPQHIRDTSIATGGSDAMQQTESQEPMFHPPPPAWMSYKSSQGRSSGGGASTTSSYFEPFEFEREGSQDFETSSVVSEATHRGDTATSARLGTVHEGRPVTPNWPLPRHEA
ncbi:hypothetical protein D0860_05441 [Hortaea werneckii]|uniref:Mid2 domain-containing protein n=1 Tax=Hortaea werneckii TaxID=91943 RepID=A0A3M7H0V9_HORWE|nr:hypothetical protein D0860_05441 [Hortaea werneckii]